MNNSTTLFARGTGLLVIEVINSNPNGDPDRESDPRQRPDGHGEISPVSFKRKLRDLVENKNGTVWPSIREELTLDDSGGLSPMDSGDSATAQVKGDSVEKDIFETDFEVPALEDDSGSQVAPLDTDLDSSDFDIALDDSAVEDESASQVVALDEEADHQG